ncbi:MAG: hypothetical protein ACMV1K_14300 [Sulfurospirillum sp.]
MVNGYEKINMLKMFATYGGLYVNYALMALSFALVSGGSDVFLPKKANTKTIINKRKTL